MLAALLLATAPVTIEEKTDLLNFRYAWSAEAAAVPALDRRFRAEVAKVRAEAMKNARADRGARLASGSSPGDWNPHLFQRSWTTAGQTPRLLSLESATAAFTGGAHPNSGTTALLWDRRRGREIALSDLLRPGQSWDGAIRQPFCILLDRERARRRQERVQRGEWPNQCPALKELTLTLADESGDRRFDHLAVTADPYVAGPYAEGPYEIALPITARMVARLRPQYRPSFEPQPPVQ